MISRRSFLKRSMIASTCVALPLSVLVGKDASGTMQFSEEAASEPELASRLSGCLLMEFEAPAFDHAMRQAKWFNKKEAIETGWFVREGEKVWALSSYYQSPVDGKFVSVLSSAFNYAAVNVAHMTDGTVWKSRDGLSFESIVARAPNSVLTLEPLGYGRHHDQSKSKSNTSCLGAESIVF